MSAGYFVDDRSMKCAKDKWEKKELYFIIINNSNTISLFKKITLSTVCNFTEGRKVPTVALS